MISDSDFGKRSILVVTGFWPSYSNSIAGIFVVQQIAAMVRAGYEVVVVLPRVIGRGGARPLTISELGLPSGAVKFSQVPYIRLPEMLTALPGALSLNILLAKLCVGSGVRRLLNGRFFSMAVIHGLRYCGLSLPGWAKLVGSCSVIVHGVDPLLARNSNNNSVKFAVGMMGEECDSIVLVGNSLRLHALAIGLPENRLRVVFNGTDIPSLATVSSSQRSLTQIRRVLSVCNLIPLKGVDLNLRALAALKVRRPELDWEYRVVGDGPMASSLRQLAQALGILDRVCFVGRLDYATTMAEMAACDVFSLPSWGEAFGIVYLEAMARMRPVVGCFSNGAEDIIDDGVNGCLVQPGDVDALSRILERLLEGPDYCVQLGVEARRKAEQFSWDVNVSKLLSHPAEDSGVCFS